MKKTITAIIMVLMVMASGASAYSIPVDNPALSLEGNDVHVKVSLKEGGSFPEVQVLFYGATSGFSENAYIQPYFDWYYGSESNKTTMKDMYAQGWRLIQMIPYNSNAAKQFYLIFQK